MMPLPSQRLAMLRFPQRLTLAQAIADGLQIDRDLRALGYADGAAGGPRDPEHAFSLGYMGGYLDGSRYGRRKEG